MPLIVVSNIYCKKADGNNRGSYTTPVYASLSAMREVEVSIINIAFGQLCSLPLTRHFIAPKTQTTKTSQDVFARHINPKSSATFASIFLLHRSLHHTRIKFNPSSTSNFIAAICQTHTKPSPPEWPPCSTLAHLVIWQSNAVMRYSPFTA